MYLEFSTKPPPTLLSPMPTEFPDRSPAPSLKHLALRPVLRAERDKRKFEKKDTNWHFQTPTTHHPPRNGWVWLMLGAGACIFYLVGTDWLFLENQPPSIGTYSQVPRRDSGLWVVRTRAGGYPRVNYNHGQWSFVDKSCPVDGRCELCCCMSLSPAGLGMDEWARVG
ncbi:hypothetical protein DFP73DRAFT_586547, partial [Morchella snyderi]